MLPTVRDADPFTDLDRTVFDNVVPESHYLRRVSAVLDFERFRPCLADAYDPTMGRPPIDPVRMLKIMFLCFHYGLSDRQVIERCTTDIAFRWFVGFGLNATVPNHTNGTHFRKRLGEERFGRIFQEVVSAAREQGLVSNRLRLKDATHLFADAAELRPLALAAQVREHLLRAAEPFFADWTAAQRAFADNLSQTTAEASDAERLAERVIHLRAMAMHLQEQIRSWPAADADADAGADADADAGADADAADPKRQRLRRMLTVTEKLLADRADPGAGDRLVSAVDPDARTGLHQEYFVGYLLDVAMDADSEIITAVNVLPGNGPEAADAITLIRQEEAAQGNDVEGLSMDGAGYNGPVLRELTDPEGLHLEVTVPPPKPAPRSTFGPERFALDVLDNGRGETTRELTCPAGQTTRQREKLEHGNRYTFKPSQCATCPMREECLQNPGSKKGRTVIKNDYEAEYRKVHEKATTPQYAQTRREHPKIERKLNELARHQGNRRARYRGLGRVLSQSFLTSMVTNVKRMVKLLGGKTSALMASAALRAEPCRR
jgi:transposase